MTLSIGWFSTGRGQGSRDLLSTVKQKIDRGDIDAEIAFAFCNREPGEFEQTDLFHGQVGEYKIPLVYLSSRKHRALRNDWPSRETWRLEYDREATKLLQAFRPDLCVLAGYMLVVGEEMCQAYDMLNLHPAAPGGPAGTWQEVIWQLIGSRARESGVMMHLAIPELDQGPPVTYCTFSIRGEAFGSSWEEISGQPVEVVQRDQGESNSLFRLIRKHGLAREFPLIVSTMDAFAQGKVRIRDKQLIDALEQPIKPYDLSEDIDQVVEETLRS
jgi:folate-dependent phosphoribosylglycinamide formyltransferase PurN